MRLVLGTLLAAGLATATYAEDAETARLRELAAKEKQQEQADLPARVSALEKKLEKTTSSDFRAYWKDGLNFETADKIFKMAIGGRVYADFVWIKENDDIVAHWGDMEDGVEFRTARLDAGGTLFHQLYFKIQYDFAPGTASAKDIYLGVKDLPVVGSVQVGHFKEPFSIEELTSSRFITFMERSTSNQAFTPGRNMGFMATNTVLEDRMSWAIGVFKDVNDQAVSWNEGEWCGTMRITGLPYYERDGKELVHVGLGASYRANTNDTVRYRARPEIHTDDRLVDTGSLSADVDDTILLAPELAVVYGPFSLQAEYFLSDNNSKTYDDPSFSGYYVFGSFFVTGESRKYKTSTAAFDRVKPSAPLFGKEGGFGAVELAVRYSSLDLNDNAVYGGLLTDITAGVNWYLNPNMRIMLNYINANVKDRTASKWDGKEDIFMMRYQFDF